MEQIWWLNCLVITISQRRGPATSRLAANPCKNGGKDQGKRLRWLLRPTPSQGEGQASDTHSGGSGHSGAGSWPDAVPAHHSRPDHLEPVLRPLRGSPGDRSARKTSRLNGLPLPQSESEPEVQVAFLGGLWPKLQAGGGGKPRPAVGGRQSRASMPNASRGKRSVPRTGVGSASGSTTRQPIAHSRPGNVHGMHPLVEEEHHREHSRAESRALVASRSIITTREIAGLARAATTCTRAVPAKVPILWLNAKRVKAQGAERRPPEASDHWHVGRMLLARCTVLQTDYQQACTELK